MKFFATAICAFFTFLNAMQCTCQTTPDFTADAEIIRKVMLDTEKHGEDAIFKILVERSNAERQEIAKEFKKQYNKDLLEDLSQFFVYDIKEAITTLMIPNDHFYAYQLHHAIDGIGTDETAISEILGSMNKSEILNVSKLYENDYKVSLKEDLMSDVSGSYMNLIEKLCDAERDEGTKVDKMSAALDARDLLDACKGHLNNKYVPDESVYISILTSRSRSQLQLVFDLYANISKTDIITTIKEEFAGDIQYGFLIIAKNALLTKSQFYAIQLRESMIGLGTNDRQLIRIIIGRSEIDLEDIKKSYKNIYETELADSVADDTSGKYRDLLLSILRK